jgi:hypothetical protein
MPRQSILLTFLLCLPISAEPFGPPAGSGQVARAVEWFADPAPPPSDPARRFCGQRTPDGKLVLTASNGFFDPGIRAGGEAEIEDGAPDSLIGPDFEFLDHWTRPGATVRWHLWVENPGAIFVNTHLAANKTEAGAKLVYQLAGGTRMLVTRAESDPAKPQGKPLVFEVPHSGWQTLTIRLESLGGKEVGRLHRLELFGPAAVRALVLRARWRPAACHARFSSSTVEHPVLWVMSTRMSPKSRVSSYSPITTPFGYFGTEFNAGGMASASANFSLWSYGRGKPTPQERWSHMLAVGSPEATFGAFGHEGSGVKLRGDWKPFGTDSKVVTLALRGELAPPWIRWFGYYLDPKTKRFRLFAAAAKWNGKHPMRSFNPGAFVEQPGPPSRRRCGDIVRDIHRSGWMLDEWNHWHPVDTMSTGKSSAIASKHWGSSGDNWFSMGMGGIPWRSGPGRPVRLDLAGQALPGWLQGSALDDLHRLPATIGKRTVTDITRTGATIRVPLSDLSLAPGESATLTIFHGPEDCLTFERNLGYPETATRFWRSHTGPVPAVEGENSISLDGLEPGSDHYLRILVESPRGKIWSFETDQFSTRP